MTLSLLWLTSLFFITIRLETVLLFTPIQAIRHLFAHARLILVFTFSLPLTNYTPSLNIINKLKEVLLQIRHREQHELLD